MKVKILQNWTLQNILWTKYFQVDLPYIFELEYNSKKHTINVPKWFITDLGSIPPVLFIFDKSRYISYILHDYLYSLVWEIVSIYGKLEYNQDLSDRILCEWLKLEGMNKTGRELVYLWLYCFWKGNYKKVNKEISELKRLNK